MKRILTGLTALMLWLILALPVLAVTINQEDFLEDMRILMQGEDQGTVATFVLMANPDPWIQWTESYCDFRDQGLGRKDILDFTYKMSEESVDDPDTMRLIQLIAESAAREADLVYCKGMD